MIHHLVFYLHRSLGIQQQAYFKYSTAHVWCVLWGVFTLQLYPIHHGQGFFLSQNSIQHGQLENTHRMIGRPWTAGCSLLTSLSTFQSPFWMTGQLDTG